MNVIEILSEASIFTRAGAYTYGHMVRISAGSKIGNLLLDKIHSKIPDFNPEEKLEWIAKPIAGSPKIQVGTGDTKIYFKRPDETGIVLIGTPSAIEKGLLHAERFNRGDIAEAVLGASLTAKLIKRGSNNIGEITESDVKQVLSNAIVKSGTELVYTVEDKNSRIADRIVFTLRLPSGSMMAIKNPNLWEKFEDLFSSGVDYCNGADAEKYSNHFYKNGKVDEVFITSDGVSDQKGRKTDVQAVVKDPATGKVRDLRNVDISLKADSNIYGQHGTGGLQAGKAVWLQKAQALFSPLGINITKPTRSVDIIDFWRQVYKQATKQFNQHFAHYTASQETMFIERLADLINRHGSGFNKEGTVNKTVKLISFEKGTYSIHSFNLLKQRLIEKKIDFGAELTIGPKSGKPSIVIYDRASGDTLTAIRYFQGGEKSSNYFEKGPLLHELTKIVKAASAPGQQAQAQTQATPAKVSTEPSKSMSPARKMTTSRTKADIDSKYEPSLAISGVGDYTPDPDNNIQAAENR